jgi:hypothetical protein
MADVAGFRPHIGASDGPGDDALAALAARQHGVVAYRQLLELGFGRRAIQSRVARGRLHRVHLAVYAVGHSALSGNGRLLAAVLACGPGALLSHWSAGAHWQLLPTSRSAVDVTVPSRTRAGNRGIVVHQARHLHPDDGTVREGIPVTSVARTLLDLAEVVRPRQLERAVEEAERLRLFDLRDLEELCERSRGRRGLRPLRAVLGGAVGEPPATRSELERRFLDLCREAGLPRPAVNLAAAGFEVDALWPRQRLVVELDGHAFHGTRAAFERDRVRDAELQLAGYRVLRLTHRRLKDEPAAVARTVATLLATS